MSNLRIRDLLHLSRIPRWTNTDVDRAQTVAEHSYNVCALSLEIAQALNRVSAFSVSTLAVLQWAIVHDGPESYTGDMPSPFKVALGGDFMAKFEIAACPWYEVEVPTDPKVATVVAIADTMEAVIYGRRHVMEPDKVKYCRDRLFKQVEQAVARFGWASLRDVVFGILDNITPTSDPTPNLDHSLDQACQNQQLGTSGKARSIHSPERRSPDR